MKAILEFDITGDEQFEEKAKLNLALRSDDLSFAIWDTYQLFRGELKYNEELTEQEYKLVEGLRDKFIEIIEERNLQFVLE